MEEANFEAFILASMPSFIAVNYQRLLETQEPQEQVTLQLHIYNLGLRTLTINLVSQYLFHDRDLVRDAYLDRLLDQKFAHLTSDAWEKILFATLRTYKDNRDLVFMPELYDFYWDTSTYPHRERTEVTLPFKRLTRATQDLQLERQPQNKNHWQALAQELYGHLHQVLEYLSFMAQYDLILVHAQDEQSYTFELHKGLQFQKSQRPLPQHATLVNGQFYLRTATEEFLPLHPLLVFWRDSIESTNIGVFDRLIERRLKYLLPVPSQNRFDEKYFKDFVYLILDAVEQIRQERQKIDRLTWEDLCDICERISTGRMATIQGKYRHDLYLQRDTVHQHMKDFLADPKKRGFVLVGKSGVGKSNFLLALAEELRQIRKDVCVLMYDGANLPVASSTLTDIISQDFTDHFQQPIQQIWHEIAKLDDINERQVIVCVDAVNENPDAARLLRQLDELVQKTSWPWLKIVLSSRPETWKEIKRGVKIAEALYYQDPDNETAVMDLEPFSYSKQMNPFTHQELPQVYGKYEREFGLKTSYQALSHQVREALRDPLQLRLLAKTYQGQAIPEHVTVSALIDQYIHTVLPREEQHFLEHRLVTLMVRENHYSNAISESDLDAASGALYEMVYSDQMNQMFCALSDADILVLQEQGREQKIAFKYERFYEYFAGKRFTSLSETQADRYSFYLKLIGEISGKKEATGKPFLWGAIRNALVDEARRSSIETILKLCRTTEQPVKEMLVNVLITLGLTAPKQVENILRHLLPQEKKVGEVQKLRQIASKSTGENDLRTRNACKIAIEVASQLNLGWALQTAALQADSTVRMVAIRHSYYLWQRDQAAGFEILEYLAKKAVTGLLPNFVACESVVGLSVIIFFDHYQNEEVLSRLHTIWHEIIARLFRIHENSSTWKAVATNFIREQIISFAISVAFRLIRELPTYNMVSYSALDSFFQLGATEKTVYRNLINYLDLNGDYSRERMEQDYLAVLKIDNVLVILTAALGLTAHTCDNPHLFLPFLKQLFETAKSDVATYPYLTIINHVAQDVLDRDPLNDEMFDFFVYTTEVARECYTRHPEKHHSRSAEAPQIISTAPYILFQHQRTGTARTPWLEAPILAALSQHNRKYFEIMLGTDLPYVAIDRQEPQAALEVLEIFFKNGDIQIDHMIQAFLSRLHIYYPDTVDEFLEEQKASEEFCLQVRTNEPSEKVGDLIAKKPWYFARDGLLVGRSELRFQFLDLFGKAAEYKDTRTWVEYMLRELVNMIYGGKILRQMK
ncbi:hypothetical protein KSD_67270 [Ktedonobacter sp. SOSP1-85]|uniref:NACHT domain-containing protein n=1 Tax=Ktedonobacter sp. SOSP1-85 TaxID=2778367 RepID=UPI00191541AE|nr:NACHT domain-containing protein [Ktedonobacter sp. SOSP1-85]GHO78956.1 hypothetical protein KSD_67270 [Ktedonobacter sp. SOSP1-85]